eukprot:scaffold6960_cov104-Isochrysis_galbana.AAC.6
MCLSTIVYRTDAHAPGRRTPHGRHAAVAHAHDTPNDCNTQHEARGTSRDAAPPARPCPCPQDTPAPPPRPRRAHSEL